MSWHNGICITTKYHSDFVEARELPCNLKDWFENQYEYSGWYDGCEILISDSDQDKIWNWHSMTTPLRFSKWLDNNDEASNYEIVIGPDGKQITDKEIQNYFIDYDEGDNIQHIAFVFRCLAYTLNLSIHSSLEALLR